MFTLGHDSIMYASFNKEIVQALLDNAFIYHLPILHIGVSVVCLITKIRHDWLFKITSFQAKGNISVPLSSPHMYIYHF